MYQKPCFLHRQSMRTCCRMFGFRSRMLFPFQFLPFGTKTDSVIGQTRWSETASGLSMQFCVVNWITLSHSNSTIVGSFLIPSWLGRYFSLDEKFFGESFRLDRRDKDPVISFRLCLVLSAAKVSRMRILVRCNTSSTDNRSGHRRKSEKSPFLSRKRDEHVVKTFAKDVKKCDWLNFVILLLWTRIDTPWWRKWRKKRKIFDWGICGKYVSHLLAVWLSWSKFGLVIHVLLLRESYEWCQYCFPRIFRKIKFEFSVGWFGSKKWLL